MSIKEIYNIILNCDTTGTMGQIIWNIRLPRIVATIVLGGGLAVSGYMLQIFFRNSIAGPYVLGISSGAKLTVALVMVASIQYGFYVKSIFLVGAAFLGAIAVTLLVLLVSKYVRNMSALIVCGVMVGYVCSALTELMISFADDSNIVNLHSWSMGTFSSIQWRDVVYFSPVVILSFLCVILISKQIEVYSHGDHYAVSVGVNVKAFRVILIVLSSILSATVTAFAGPISFVGIAVPHLVRVLFKTDRPIVLLPAAFMGGSIFCLISDLAARSLFAPTELSISTITAIFGAPIVIVMLFERRNRA